ncbi:hypothetical protein [Streptomyces sp. NPDC048669]|uniref:hypothetical protein n=1 Tax=Streptomyces sp. NPDC048669 TaxID=3155267 RepID=UPI003433591E
MPDRGRERQPDEASQDQSLVRAVESAFAALNSLGRRITDKIRKGHVILLLVVMASAGSGAAANHVFEASKPTTIISAVELGTLKMEKDSLTFGIISGVTIDDVPPKQGNNNAGKKESDGTAQPSEIYRVTVIFPKPNPLRRRMQNGDQELARGRWPGLLQPNMQCGIQKC